MKARIALVCLSLLPTTASAADVDWNASATYRPRAEVVHKKQPAADFLVSHRAAAVASGKRGPWEILGEIRDVRVWGTEPSTLSYVPSVAAHKAHLQYQADGLLFRIGRQEVNYLNQRLIGAVNWTQQGRSFDAVRLRYEWDHVSVDAFAAPVSQAQGKGARDHGVAASTLAWENAGRKLAVIGVAEWKPSKDLRRWTFGPYSKGKLGAGFGYELEAYAQASNVAGSARKMAYLASAGLHWSPSLKQINITTGAGYDRVSGAEIDNNRAAFDTLFATNHKFYGSMDLFLALPRDTGGQGLQDAHAYVQVAKGGHAVTLALHHFRPERPGQGAFGNEADLTVSATLSDGMKLQLFQSVMRAGDAFTTLYPRAPRYPTWSAVQLAAAF